MTQKDKVKELVGRGLHSYHTKALQQMDRVEKKNKEQNHKISILSNELDNDYLTKTEEGSVVSLEHSKEGMIYLDELQGNTLVNYCTDGSKEMTLNGDIDLEGTFVTTIEGVDNGKVDVACEGNTLVNIANHPNAFTVTRTEGQAYRQYDVPLLYPLKPETTYTIYLTIDKNEFDHNPFTSIVIGQGNTDNWSNRVFWNKEFGKTNTDKGLGRHKAIFTTHSRIGESNFKFIKFIFETYPEYNTTIKDIILLEGEHSEDIDNFIGMKSVGQDDINGHKIEILSAKGKPNLIKNSGFLNGTSNYSFHNGSQGEVMDDTSSQSGKILKITTGSNEGMSGPFQSNIVNYIEDKKYTLSGWCKGEPGTTLGIYIERHKSINVTFTNDDWVRFVVTSEQNPTNWNRTITFYSSNVSKVFYLKDIKIEESDNDTPYIPHISEKNYNSFNGINKKEILLNEPLRGLPNGVKDKFVKIGGKWFIERNCRGKIITKDTTKFRLTQVTTTTNLGIGLVIDKTLELADCFKTPGDNFLLEGFVNGKSGQWYEKHWGAYANSMNIVAVFPPTYTLDQMIDFIDGKQIVYKSETPTYEPLEINPELITYLDTTHISNNSLIPCNMKVQNSGYNAIIKPSTLYTIALDTNKSGTIGMNLGGAKGTTTNNVLKLTTPATLADDSLRLYGKGIKGSKVRLLEGDKTNWIPSHFEGMKSSFEDKFDATDNTYKMEILSNNKNLMNFEVARGYSDNWEAAEGTDVHEAMRNKYPIQVKPNTKYCVEVETTHVDAKFYVRFFDENKKYIGGSTLFTYEKGGKYSSVFTSLNNKRVKYMNIHQWSSTKISMDTLKYIKVAESSVIIEIPKHKSNKIQLSSIKPLRSVDIAKDRLCIKDNKLMIERNCGEIVLNGTETISEQTSYNKSKTNMYEIQKTLARPNGYRFMKSDCFSVMSYVHDEECISSWDSGNRSFLLRLNKARVTNIESVRDLIRTNNIKIVYKLLEPTYEEIPYELQKIILEGYENGTLFFDTNIPPTSTITYAGETPIVKSVRLNKTEVLNNTNDINDNIIPYLMDMDYRVVCLQLESEEFNGGVAMAKLFGGAYEMLQRDIQSKRYSVDEYRHRLDAYLGANKITEDEYNKLGDMLNE